jgi:hypothetical protein
MPTTRAPNARSQLYPSSASAIAALPIRVPELSSFRIPIRSQATAGGRK